MAGEVPSVRHPLNPVEVSASSLSEEKQIQEIQKILNARFANTHGKPVGCKLVIMREGQAPYELRAGAIAEQGSQHWGSVSKQFTAACIAQLVHEGLLHYDDDIRTLGIDLPEFKIDGVAQRITIDHLLHMHSGLPDVWDLAYMSGRNPESLSNDELLDLLVQYERHSLSEHRSGMLFAPEAKYTYCNTNYFLLAKIVEKVAKDHGLLTREQTFVDFVKKYVFDQYNMRHTRCAAADDPRTTDVIPGFSDEYEEDTTPTRSFGATGVVGPPMDMADWNRALAHREFYPEIKDLLVAPRDEILARCANVRGSRRFQYCRGLFTCDMGDYRRIHHGGLLTGSVTGFRRYECVDHPERSFAFFFATNYEDTDKAEETQDAVANVLAGRENLEVHEKKEPPKPPSGREEEARRFVGAYTCVEFETDWNVSVQEGKGSSWEVCLDPADHRVLGCLRKPIAFPPTDGGDGYVLFSIPGLGQLTRTEDGGFICGGETIAPVHFKKKT